MDSWNIKDKKCIVIPVNNSEDRVKTETGSHWSLLLYTKCDNKFFHYDSLDGVNNTSAKVIVGRLSNYLQIKTPAKLHKLDGPIQTNGFDCGLHVILAAELIIQNLKGVTTNRKIPKFSQSDCTTKRAFLSMVLKNRHSITPSLIKQYMFKSPIPETKEHNKAIEATNVLLNCEKDFPDKINITEKKQVTDCTVSRIMIYGDSHAKYCVQNLDRVSSFFGSKVTGHVNPGAPLTYIYDNIKRDKSSFSENDVVVIIGGTNSIEVDQVSTCKMIEDNIINLSHTNVVLTTVPYRYDKPQDNARIYNLNKKMYGLVEKHSEVSFIPINNLLTREHYTQHGLHLNRKGKELLSNLIALHVTIKLRNTSKKSPEVFCPSGQKVTQDAPPNNKDDLGEEVSEIRVEDCESDSSHSNDHLPEPAVCGSPFLGFSTPDITTSKINLKNRNKELPLRVT